MKLFEESWEVCNKVGGIYTVLSTKAKYLVEKYGKDYFLIGPFVKNNIEYVEEPLPSFLEKVYTDLSNMGIKVHYGYWNIDGKPQVILVDFYDFFKKEINYWKYKYWEWYRIDSLGSDYTYDEPFSWSVAVGILLEELDKVFPEKKVLHAHEWLSGGTILYLKAKGLGYRTIFTIHGTVLGRSLSSRNIDVIETLNKINPDQEAYSMRVHYKHQMEKNAVKHSDIFTTVSPILAKESEVFLGKSPDRIIYNAILSKDRDIYKDYLFARRWLEEFVVWYFFPYYYIDLKNTFFMYTIGRYEYYNKGLDLVIKIAKRLNEENIGKNIIFFIFVPTGVTGIYRNVIRLYSSYRLLKEILEKEKTEIVGSILREDYSKIRKIFEEVLPKISKGNKPDIITHELFDKNDLIYNELQKAGLDNEESDRVKIIYAPVYIGQDIIFDLPKEKILPGFDLGIFLSRYEPFGYTALESLYYGVPIVLSNRTGFALSLDYYNLKSDYICLVDVKNIDNEEEKIIEFIRNLSSLDPARILDIRKELYNISKFYDWSSRILDYISLYES
ncbi:hypothetical protein BA065_00090 [Nanoarchaeota archaeon NZ13-N]|nr:MAG: hypothetical protein BA065_00090 [Nanoarchaeota archaeon NZ13-N]